MISRTLLPQLQHRLKDKKAIVLLGARQTGKTTLIQALTAGLPSVAAFTGNDPVLQRSYAKPGTEELKALLGDAKLVVIDEAQRIDGIGGTAKLMIDQLGRKVILSGSSALELNNKIQEPLTGRKWTFQLFPIS